MMRVYMKVARPVVGGKFTQSLRVLAPRRTIANDPYISNREERRGQDDKEDGKNRKEDDWSKKNANFQGLGSQAAREQAANSERMSGAGNPTSSKMNDRGKDNSSFGMNDRGKDSSSFGMNDRSKGDSSWGMSDKGKDNSSWNDKNIGNDKARDNSCEMSDTGNHTSTSFGMNDKCKDASKEKSSSYGMSNEKRQLALRKFLFWHERQPQR